MNGARVHLEAGYMPRGHVVPRRQAAAEAPVISVRVGGFPRD